jgi:hypothetical protein
VGAAVDAFAVDAEVEGSGAAAVLFDGTITAALEAGAESFGARPACTDAVVASLVGRAESPDGRIETAIAATTPSAAAAPSASPTRAPPGAGASNDVGDAGGGVAPEAGPSAEAGGATASFVLS